MERGNAGKILQYLDTASLIRNEKIYQRISPAVRWSDIDPHELDEFHLYSPLKVCNYLEFFGTFPQETFSDISSSRAENLGPGIIC